MFSQMFSGMTQVWLQVSLLVGILAVLIFKPERIRDVTRFRVACVIFAVAILLPGIGSLFPNKTNPQEMLMGGSQLALVFNIVGFVGFAASLLMVTSALMPKVGGKDA